MKYTFAPEAGESEKATVERFLGYTVRLTLEGWHPIDIKPVEVWNDDNGFVMLRFEFLNEEGKKAGIGNVALHEPHEFHVY